MAHLREVYPPRCALCGRPAKFELFNQYNASHGMRCASCGKRTLTVLKLQEKNDARHAT